MLPPGNTLIQHVVSQLHSYVTQLVLKAIAQRDRSKLYSTRVLLFPHEEVRAINSEYEICTRRQAVISLKSFYVSEITYY